jgi:hypothetical protein
MRPLRREAGASLFSGPAKLSSFFFEWEQAALGENERGGKCRGQKTLEIHHARKEDEEKCEEGSRSAVLSSLWKSSLRIAAEYSR